MTSQNTSRDEFDLLLGEWMESEARVREPEHLLDSVLERTRSARRIPRWLVLERWIPVQLTMPLRAAPRLAPLLLVMVLVLAAIAVAVVLVGSKPRLPDPFGPAANGRVAFLSNGQIHTANPDGSNPIQLTFGSRPAATPVWSRDGTRVAYKLISPLSPANDPTLVGDLIVVNADGTNPVTIDRDLNGMSPTTWSPDSRWLLYSRRVGTIDQIYVAPADGSTAPIRVVDRATTNWQPLFSPDGSKIAYFVDGAVEVMNRDGSAPQRLKSTTFQQLSTFEWRPDGKQVVVSAAASDEAFDLWILSLDGAPERHLRVPGRAEIGPTWSPDGSRLLYLTTKDGRTTTVAVADADGTNERLLIGGYGMINPTWSPDGSRIAAVNDLGTFARVTILDPDGVAKPILIDGTLPAPSFIAARSDTPTWQRIAP